MNHVYCIHVYCILSEQTARVSLFIQTLPTLPYLDANYAAWSNTANIFPVELNILVVLVWHPLTNDENLGCFETKLHQVLIVL